MSDQSPTPGGPGGATEPKDVFVRLPGHPEAVAHFPQKLEEMAQVGPDGKLITKLDTKPVDASAIDPDTLLLKDGVKKVDPIEKSTETAPQVEADPGKVEKKSKRGWLIGTGLATAAVTAVALLIPHGSDESKEPVRPPESSAPANPGASEPTKEATQSPETQTPESLIGIATPTGENINVAPSDEVEKEALRPVTAKEFKTPEEAFARFTYLENILRMGADIDDSGAIVETPASMAYRDQLHSIMYSAGATDNFESADRLRMSVSLSLWFVEGAGHIDGKTGTYHVSRTVDNVTDNGDGTWTLEITETPATNLTAIDPTLIEKVPDINDTFTRTVVLSQKDGIWHQDSVSLSTS